MFSKPLTITSLLAGEIALLILENSKAEPAKVNTASLLSKPLAFHNLTTLSTSTYFSSVKSKFKILKLI